MMLRERERERFGTKIDDYHFINSFNQLLRIAVDEGIAWGLTRKERRENKRRFGFRERERERGWDVAGGVRFLPRRPIASRSTYPFSGFWSWRLRCLVGNMDRRKQWATQHLPLVCVVKLRLVVLAVVSFLTIHRHQPPLR